MICLNNGVTSNQRERQALRLRLFRDPMEPRESRSERQEERGRLSLKLREVLGVLWGEGSIHPHQLCALLLHPAWVLIVR